jgi:drug/metabolite transporter (DMT)-like permease
MAFPWNSVVYKIASCTTFSMLNAMIKSTPLSALWIVFIQNLGAFLWATLCCDFRLRRALFHPYALLRALFALEGVILWAISLKKFSLFQTISMGLFSPCATVALAVLFLREKLTWKRGAAIALSSIGGLCMHCGLEIFQGTWWQHISLHTLPLWPLLATFCFAASNILAKKLLLRSTPEEVGFSLFALTALGAFIGIIASSQGVIAMHLAPLSSILHASRNLLFWKNVLALGSLTFLSHLMLNRALFGRQILFLLPFGATKPLTSAFLGWYFFHEPWPTLWMWAGSLAMLVAISLLSTER